MVDFLDNIEDETATFGKRHIYERTLVLGYETGSIMRAVVHAQGVTDEKERFALIADGLAELSDTVTQAGMAFHELFELAGPKTRELYTSFDTLIELGKERQHERMADWRARRKRGSQG